MALIAPSARSEEGIKNLTILLNILIKTGKCVCCQWKEVCRPMLITIAFN